MAGKRKPDLLPEIWEEVKSQRSTLTHILTVQERQHATLDEHIRRTEAAERAVAVLQADLAPLKTHAAVWGAIAKGIGAVGALVSLAVAAIKLIAMLG